MATNSVNSSDSAGSRSPDVLQFDQYIDTRIDQTRAQIKWNDVGGMFMLLAAGILAFLLIAALVDHWIVGLGVWGRILAFSLLSVGAAYYLCACLFPLALQRINPVYAARVIEQGSPSLKNSLVNFLLFRSNRAVLRSVVYQAIEERAATDLSHVELESVIDRSRLIRIGYVLAGLVALCCLYKLVSPKDPMQTVGRIVFPWADINRPSRVLVEEVYVDDVGLDVQRDEVSVFQGQFVTVSAKVRGVRNGEHVALIFSTQDSQIVDQPILMDLPPGALRYQATLPSGEEGVQQDISFHVEAGDAISPTFRLKALSAPSIVVRSIEYDFPDYTGRENIVVKRQGDIKALEGTRVTIDAKTNHPIGSAHIYFDPDRQSRSTGGRSYKRMTVDGQDATVAFTLELDRHRQAQKNNSYQLRFETQQGQRSNQAVEHLIEVLRDLSPEVEILTPPTRETDVPEDSSQLIEIRARDPDFGLTGLRLLFVSGTTVLTEDVLLDDPGGQTGAVSGKFRFIPREFGLKAGDRVTVRATAADNRMAAVGSTLAPNTSSTADYQLNIVAPENPGGEDPGADQQQASQENAPAESATGGTQAGDEQGGSDGAQPAESDVGTESSDSGPEGAGHSGESEGGESEPPDQSAADGSSEGDPRADEPPGQSQAEGGQPGRRLNNDGTEDGDVFDEIIEHMRERGHDVAQPGEKTDSQDDPGVSAADSDPSEDESGGPQSGQEGSDTGGQSAPQDEPDEGAAEGSSDQPVPGQGDSGQSGVGKPDESSGAPEASGDNRPANNSTDPDQQQQEGKPQEALSPSTSSRQSDSEGEPGDKSGGGSAGGGQPAKQPGNDSPGSSSAADDGAGAAQEPGKGETSDRAGKDQRAAGETGQSGQEAGDGAHAGQGSSSGGQPTGGQPDSSSREPGQSSGGSDPAGDQKRGDQFGAPGPHGAGNPTAGGQPGEGGPPPESIEDGDLAGDDQGLEYAREAVDLVLDYLKNQQDNELLDKLEWSKQEMDQWIEEWERIKREAARNNPSGQAAKRELDEALRSLGLHPGPKKVRKGQSPDDQLRGVRDAGRSSAPPEYNEQTKAYQKSTAGGEEGRP